VTRLRRGLAVTTLLLVVALGLLLAGWFPQEPLRRLAEAKLREALGPGAHIGRLRVVPGTLTAEVEGLVIDTPAWRLQADRVGVRLARETLRAPGLHLRELQAANVAIELRTPKESAPSSPPPTGPFRIDVVDVTNARVRWSDPEMAGEVHLDGVGLSGSIGHGTIRLRASGGAWTREPAVLLGPADAVLAIGPDLSMRLESLGAGLTRSRVTASGNLGRPGALKPELRFDADLWLEELVALADPARRDVTGLVQVEGTVTGTSDAPRVDAAYTAKQLTLVVPVETAEGRLKVVDGAVEATGALRTLGGTVALDARRAAEGQVAARAEARRVDLARLAAFGVPASVRGRGNAEAQGTMAADGRLDVLWSVDADSSEGTLQARGRSLGKDTLDTEGTFEAVPTALPAGSGVRGRFATRPGGRVISTAEVSGLGEPVHVELDLQGERARRLLVETAGLDLARFAPDVAGRAVARLELHGTAKAPGGTGTVAIEGLRHKDLDLGPLEARLDGERGTFRVDVRAPRWNAVADLVASTVRRRVEGTVRLDGTKLDGLAPDVQGTVSGEVTLDVPLDAPERARAEATITTLDARRGAWPVRNVEPLRLTLQDRVLELVQVAVATTAGRLAVRGRVDLRPADPTADLALDGTLDLAQLPGKEGTTVTGEATIAARITGTQRAPLAEGTASLGPFRVVSEGLPPVRGAGAVATLHGDRLHLPATAIDVAGGQVHIEADVPFAATGTGHLAARWEGISVAEALRAARPAATGAVDATLAGTLMVEGRRDEPASAQGTVRLEPFRALVNELPVEIGAVDGVLDSGRLALQPVRVAASGSTVETRATFDLVKREVLAASQGTIDLRALSPFLDETALTGSVYLDVGLEGPWARPRIDGAAALEGGSARLRAIPQALTDINAHVDFDGSTLRLSDGSARLGGGPITATGSARIADKGVQDLDVALTGRGIALRYPVGLRTRLDADLRLTGGGGQMKLGGEVRATRGLYDLDAALDDAMRAEAVVEEDSPALRAVALDLRVVTTGPIAVRGYLLDAEAEGDLTVRGDASAPAPFGSLRLREGGKVFLSGHEFQILRGSRGLTYAGNWDAAIYVEAETLETIRDEGTNSAVTVKATLQQTLLEPRLSLSSTQFSEHELVSLLTTGDTRSGSGAKSVGTQAAAALVGSKVSRQLQGLGFDEVRVQPELVAREGDVQAGARFTFGKRLTPWAKLVYSANLQDAEGRWLQVEVAPTTRNELRLSGRRADDGTLSTGAGQRFRFGGPKRPPRTPEEPRVRLESVSITGDRPLEEAELRALIGTEAGDRRTIWQLQERADEAREKLVEKGYLEAEVALRLDGAEAVFDVRGGPRFAASVRGMDDPPSLEPTLREALFEEEALEKGRARLLEVLHGRGHLRAAVSTSSEAVGDRARTLVFEVRPGPHLVAEVSFPGAVVVGHGDLLEAAGGAGRLVTDAPAARAGIVALYRSRHHLATEVGEVQVRSAGAGALHVVVPVEEGPRARLARVEFKGTTRDGEELRRALKVEPGVPWSPLALDAALLRLQGHYFGLGYPEARVAQRARPEGADIVSEVTVVEGPQVMVGRVEVRGLSRTREGMVRDQIDLQPGAPLDARKLPAMEQDALALGTFAQARTSYEGSPATVTLDVKEGERFVASYEVRYDEEDKGSGYVDGELRNLFGIGLAVGARQLVGVDNRETTVSLAMPALVRGGRLTVRGFYLEEDLPLFSTGAPAEVYPKPQDCAAAGVECDNLYQEKGGSLEQKVPLTRRAHLLFGYTFKRLRQTLIYTDFTYVDPSVTRVSGLDFSVVRDTRDHPLDPKAGLMTSVSLRYAPGWIQSDLKYARGFAQAFWLRPMGTGFTWAQGARIGLASGFENQPVHSSERFNGGGSHSVRGYGTDSLGPIDVLGETIGGEATVVLNEELRWRHASGFGAAVFWDAGQVWESVKKMKGDPALRHGAGVGLRYLSPVGLLRLDAGWALTRHKGDDPWRLHFSLGQIF
jgi:outer membrane protein insertion porin family